MNSLRRTYPSTLFIETLEGRIAPAAFVFTAGRGIVTVSADLQANGTYADITDSFVPFPGYKGAITVAAGDFDGDGNDELVTAKATGTSPEVRIWDLASGGVVTGLIDSIVPFTGKIRGASVAAGDVNNDGKSELLIGAGPGGAPNVAIYSDSDSDLMLSDNLIDTFSAFDSTFKGGVKLAAGNTNNAGGAEIIAGAWTKGGAVRVFVDANSDNVISTTDATPLEEGSPFGDKYHGGVNLASAALQSVGNSGAELIVSKPKGTPTILIFADANNSGTVFDETVADTLSPGGDSFRSGANLAAGDTDNSGFFAEVIAAPASARGNTFRIFDDSGDAGVLLSDDTPLSFAPFADDFSGGIYVAVGKVRAETYTNGAFPVSIPDSSSIESSLIVPSAAGVIRDVDVSLNIAHSFDGDLDVTLTHVPTGTTITLFNDVGGTNEGFIIRLNDEAGVDIETASNPKLDGAIVGTFNPEGTALLSIFDALDASGEWRLSITDDSGGDTGSLLSWSLHFNYGS